MFLMYVDESGDVGTNGSPTRYFALTGVVMHELRWRPVLDSLIDFRRFLREQYKLKLRQEIHASEYLSKRIKLQVPRNQRLEILRHTLKWAASQQELSVITVIVDKNNHKDNVFEIAWSALIQRFENTIRYGNFPKPSNADDKGIILPDNTDGKKLTMILRKMRRYNVIPNKSALYSGGSRNAVLNYIIEDPHFKDSANSLIHQVVDVIAYFARQQHETSKYLRTKGGRNYYKILDPVLQKKASTSNELGIVYL